MGFGGLRGPGGGPGWARTLWPLQKAERAPAPPSPLGSRRSKGGFGPPPLPAGRLARPWAPATRAGIELLESGQCAQSSSPQLHPQPPFRGDTLRLPWLFGPF